DSTASTFGDKPIDGPVERGDVKVMVCFAEGARIRDVEAERSVAPASLAMGHQAAERTCAQVGVDVAASQTRERGVADDVAADDRATRAVRIRVDRPRVVAAAKLGVAVEGVTALEPVPAEVRPAQRAVGLVVDLLGGVLADIADRDPAAVEGKAVRVAQA